MLSRGISVKRRYGGGLVFALGCGCKDAKSVSVSASSTTTETRRRGGRTRTNPSASTTTTDTLTSASSTTSSFVWEDAVAEFDQLDQSSAGAEQSFSGLLRELGELEQNLASWGRKSQQREEKLSAQPQDRVEAKPSTPPPREHMQQATMMRKRGDVTSTGDDSFEAVLDGSVAVVKQSEDPLGDFRRSMVQMIVEDGMVAGEELREMLLRFLGLNAPHHHDAILRAFAEVWDAVFFTDDDDHHRVPATATIPARRERQPSPGRPPVPRPPPPRHCRSPSSAWRV